MTARPAALAFIFALVVVDVIAMGVVIPVLPKLVESFEGGDTARAAAVYGVFGTAWALMQFFAMPILGAASDRFGRRPVILVSCLGLGLDYFLMALAPNLAWLFVGRVISGITAASISTAFAYIADVSPPEKRAAAFGMIGAGFGLGFTLGPALGGLLGGIDPRLPFWVAGVLALANAAYGYFVLPESLPKEKRSPFRWARANPVGSLKLLRSHRELYGIAAVLFLMQLSHVVFPAVTVLYMGYRYGWGEMTVGLVLAAVGVCSMIVQGGLIRPVVKRIGERHALGAGPRVRRPRHVDLRRGAGGLDLPRRDSRDGPVGARGPLGAGDHEPARESLGAGAVAGRDLQPAGDHRHDRADALHAGVRAVHRQGLGPARARHGLLRGLGAAGPLGDHRVAGDAPPGGPSTGTMTSLRRRNGSVHGGS